jgi:hypothetical protein
MEELEYLAYQIKELKEKVFELECFKENMERKCLELEGRLEKVEDKCEV